MKAKCAFNDLCCVSFAAKNKVHSDGARLADDQLKDHFSLSKKTKSRAMNNVRYVGRRMISNLNCNFESNYFKI